MSWSVNYMGTPQAIAESLDKYSSDLSGYSKEEFDAALPHLKGLLAENFGDQYVRQLIASGHTGDTSRGAYRQCNVELKNLGAIKV